MQGVLKHPKRTYPAHSETVLQQLTPFQRSLFPCLLTHRAGITKELFESMKVELVTGGCISGAHNKCCTGLTQWWRWWADVVVLPLPMLPLLMLSSRCIERCDR